MFDKRPAGRRPRSTQRRASSRRRPDWSSSVVGTHAVHSSSSQRRAASQARRTRSLEGRAATVSQIHFSTRSIDERTARHQVGGSRAESFMRRRNTMSRAAVVIAIVAVLAVALGLGTCAFRNSLSSSMALGDDSVTSALVKPASQTDVQYLLLAGIGNDEGKETASFVAVMRIDPQAKSVSILNIPTAIAESYDGAAEGQNMLRDAPSAVNEGELVKRVSALLDQDINHYVRITEQGFVSLVDSLGGITLDVGEYVDDPSVGTAVLDAGEQTLNGEQALVYVSAKNYKDGFGTRAANQTTVLNALIDAIEAKGGLSFAMSADSVAGAIKTDMSYDDLSAIAGFYPDAEVKTASLPGSQAVSGDDVFWSIDSSGWAKVRDGFKSGGSMDTSIDTSGVDKQALSIIVLNGAGTDGFSAQAAQVLTDAGYTVGETGNADSFVYNETLVIYRDSEDATAAEAIVQDLGTGRAVSAGVYYSLKTDIQVVVGKDWTGRA